MSDMLIIDRETVLHELNYLPSVGEFTRRISNCSRTKVGELTGNVNTGGYVQIMLNGRLYLRSRLVWLCETGAMPKLFLDHKDTDRLNDVYSNLREVTKRENAENRKPNSTGKSGLIGVYPVGNDWWARIKSNGEVFHLGTFRTRRAAFEAYVAAKIKIHGGFNAPNYDGARAALQPQLVTIY